MSEFLGVMYRLGRYEITRVLGSDGAGVDYEASTVGSGQQVVIREYLPAGLMERSGDQQLRPRRGVRHSTVDAGLATFLAQHMALTHVSHPAIVGVHACLRANGTGYAVVDQTPGQTLDARLGDGGRLSATEVAQVLMPLLEGIERVHRSRVCHGAIDPDHLVLSADGSPKLIGFGPRKLVRKTKEGTGTNGSSGGYAAPEQCASEGSCGPRTDIYGLAAVVYRCVTGVAPPTAAERIKHDELVPAVELARGLQKPHVLEAIDHGLAVMIDDRPATVEEWRAALAPRAAPQVRVSDRIASALTRWRRRFGDGTRHGVSKGK